MLDHWFESEPLKAALGWDSVVGNFASPYTPGSAYVLLHHVFGETHGKTGVWGHADRGHGRDHAGDGGRMPGAGDMVTDAAVAQVQVGNGRATGVELDDGRRFTAACVVANVNPKLLYTRLVEAAHLDADTRERTPLPLRLGHLPHERGTGRTAGLHRCPRCHAAAASSKRILVAPSLGYMDGRTSMRSPANTIRWAR